MAEDQAPRAAISEEEVSALLEKNGADAVRPYDFTAQRINRTQLPLLEVISKSFADRAGASLSTLVGRDATVQFTSLEAAKGGDLQAALPTPRKAWPWYASSRYPASAFASVEPALLLTLLDGFFGGSGRAVADAQAAVAPRRAALSRAACSQSCRRLHRQAWAPVTPLELELVKQETNPRLVQMGAANESVLVLKFTVEFGARSGRIDWPSARGAASRPCARRLPPTAARRRCASRNPGPPYSHRHCKTPRSIPAQFSPRRKSACANSGAAVAGRHHPHRSSPQQATLFAGDVPLYRGRFGVSQGRNALMILSGAST